MSAAIAVPAADRPRRRWIWISLALVTVLVVAGPLSLRLWLKAAHHNLNLPASVYSQPLTSLDVVAPAGGVTIVPSRRAAVTVRGQLAWVFSRPSVSLAVRGSALRVTGACPAPNAFEDCQVSLTIRVPANLAVDVSVGVGSVTVRGLTGPLHLSATSGSIMMTGVSGPVWASAGAGSVAGDRLRSPELDTVIGSGSVQLGLAATPRTLNLAIGAGSAHIAVPPGTRLRTQVSPGAGVWHITPGIADPRAAATLIATIGSGVLTVGYAR
jgi:hypothetical protein